MIGIIAAVLAVLALLLLVIGGIWMLVLAFQRSIVWGICYLFVPFAALVFLVVAWADVRRAFMVQLAGLALCFVPILLLHQSGFDFQKNLTALAARSGALPELPESLSQPKDSLQSRFAELTARETDLRARKAALNPNDAAATRALTEEIRHYNTDLEAANAEKRSRETVAVVR